MTKRSNMVQSLVRALDIIELLDREGELGISEISNTLGLEKTTVHRLISTLKFKGYVAQNKSNQKYSNSFKLFEMGNNVVEGLGLRRQAQPFMEELAEKSHEAVNLAILNGKHMFYIDKIESSETIKVDLRIGKRLPVYCTGLGKAMLAFMPEERVHELFKGETFVKYTKNTIDNVQGLMLELRRIKAQGYSIDNEEYIPGLVCVAAPVMSFRGEAVAALSVAVPKYRLEEGERDLGCLIGLVRTAAEKLSREMGHMG
ncbi:MAG: Transcriptional regulator, IclR family [Firmicutes bacterium]|nr:Transcriptional regulator, IclR family [Bacillota bacterium]MDI6705095.1 IclR family transcriptional regulator [Bacillota bacterium]